MITALVVSFALFTTAQAQQKAAWKEMDEFHTVMAATFHPAEEGDLGPIRARSNELREKAVAWQSAPVPAGYDAAKTTAALKKLVTGAKALEKMIVTGAATDDKIVTRLTALHDTFHEIMEKCRKEDHH